MTQSNSLVLGSINGVNGATANTNVGIGTTAPAYTLDVHGTGNFTDVVTFATDQNEQFDLSTVMYLFQKNWTPTVFLAVLLSMAATLLGEVAGTGIGVGFRK